jgi:deoxyribodipyrimidine photo-lyase
MSDGATEGATGEFADGDVPTAPVVSDVPSPAEVCTAPGDPSGHVVWHRKHLRLDDQRALARATTTSDAVCPLFVFDPTFYGGDGLACDARVRFLHEGVASLDRLYAAAPGRAVASPATDSRERLTGTALDPRGASTGDGDGNGAVRDDALGTAETAGLTVGLGDPVDVLGAFVDRGWRVVTMATPTSRYGKRRDERVQSALGDAVEFVSGDGLVRGEEWPRTDWSDRVERWLAADQHTPDWSATRLALDTGVTPRLVDDAHGIAPGKRKVPTGTHRRATRRLAAFTDRIGTYPGNISAPSDARGGTSELSPYLNFGLLSVRQVHQHVHEHAPDCRGRRMFTDRLVWNMHYNQKLVDWPGWTDRAVNPALAEFNEDRHDPALVEAWKHGETGYPMVDASMRCLHRTGWLNFRMRAMAASFFAHVLQQPWWIGADWYHHHLVDSDVGINYTQWQSQAGLIGKPAQRVYNPRKQVRDHDPEGAWIREYVPELEPLPAEFLDRPEHAPLAVQEECGVVIGEDYPRPVVDFEARRETFWSRYERVHPEAASELARPEVAKRASFSGGYPAARAIAAEHGRDAVEDDATQVSLAEVADGNGDAGDRPGPDAPRGTAVESATAGADDTTDDLPVPTGAGERAGKPSPDDSAAVPDGDDGDAPAGVERIESDGDDDSTQTSIGTFQ